MDVSGFPCEVWRWKTSYWITYIPQMRFFLTTAPEAWDRRVRVSSNKCLAVKFGANQSGKWEKGTACFNLTKWVTDIMLTRCAYPNNSVLSHFYHVDCNTPATCPASTACAVTHPKWTVMCTFIEATRQRNGIVLREENSSMTSTSYKGILAFLKMLEMYRKWEERQRWSAGKLSIWPLFWCKHLVFILDFTSASFSRIAGNKPRYWDCFQSYN